MGDESSVLNKKLEELEKELNGSREELEKTKADLEKATMELARAKKELKSALQTVNGKEAKLGAIKGCLDGKATELESIKMELDSERRAQQGLEAELVVTREALVVSNNKSSNGPTLARRLMIFLFVLFFLHWFIWTWMQLPLAVVSRIDSAHVYAEMSEAWMTMSEAGWFEGLRRLAAPRKAEEKEEYERNQALFI